MPEAGRCDPAACLPATLDADYGGALDRTTRDLHVLERAKIENLFIRGRAALRLHQAQV